MDPIKKRKIGDNGITTTVDSSDAFTITRLTSDDARKILEPLTHENLIQIVQNAILRHADVLSAVRSIADREVSHRKLFIRGLGWETTTENLRSIFSSFGELEEAVVILDKVTGKSKGYGFITFKHMDGAVMALKEPSKQIDGRMTVTQLAAAGASGGSVAGNAVAANTPAADVSARKIYVANVPHDMNPEKLLQHFLMYGEIEEGPVGLDKVTGKFKGYALFVYKTTEAAKASLVDPVKSVHGHQLSCKLAIDGKRGKPSGVGPVAGGQGNVNGVGAAALPVGQYGSQHGGFSGGLGGGGGGGLGGPASSEFVNQPVGINMGVGGGFNGQYHGGSQLGGPVASGYGGLGGSSGSGFGSGGGVFSGAGGGFGGSGSGMGRDSAFGFPRGSSGTDYPHSSNYNLPSGGFQGHYNPPVGALPPPRAPPGANYRGLPPYY